MDWMKLFHHNYENRSRLSVVSGTCPMCPVCIPHTLEQKRRMCAWVSNHLDHYRMDWMKLFHHNYENRSRLSLHSGTCPMCPVCIPHTLEQKRRMCAWVSNHLDH